MAPFVVSILSLCVSVFAFLFLRAYVRRKTAATQMLAEYRDEVGRLIAEIDAATDRDSILVEERIKILRRMLDDVDKRIATQIKEAQRSREGEAMYDSLGRGIRAALDSRSPHEQHQPSLFPADFAPLQESVPAPPPQVELEEAFGKKRGSRSRRANVPAETGQREKADVLPEESRPTRAQIAEMSALGASPQAIASKLDISIAEVELALNLLNRSVG